MQIQIRKICTAMFLSVLSVKAHADEITPIPERPAIMFNRWQEDWSVLADPRVPRKPLDSLKYIPLSSHDPKTYLSLGADVRERYESNDAMNFGIGANGVPQSYVISRMEAHADLHVANQVQAFVQLQSDFAPGKTIMLPVDQDRLGVEQAFITITEPLGAGIIKFRTGRQQFAFDLQRFVSVRDGPNVRQSYDAIWLDYELTRWRFITFFSHPVQNRNVSAFDDYSSSHLTYGGVRAEYKIDETIKVSSYISHYRQDGANYPSVSGNERRGIFDMRFVGKAKSYDWDFEFMGQNGTIATENIFAWAIGSLSGYTFESTTWQPRIGLQFDAASGNHSTNTLGTFNPLFPNGEYLTLSGYTGYTNFIHLKPSITVKPIPSLSIMFATAAQWRQTTKDAVYTQPIVPVPGTVGEPGKYTGTYFQGRLDWQMSPQVHNALEIDRFHVANAIRRLGGHDSTYIGIETKLGW